MLSCFYKKKLKIKKKIAKGLDRTVLATGSCGSTPVLGVHGIATYVRFFMLKKPVFIPIFGFHGPTSRSGPVLRTMFNTTRLYIFPIFHLIRNYVHITYLLCVFQSMEWETRCQYMVTYIVMAYYC